MKKKIIIKSKFNSSELVVPKLYSFVNFASLSSFYLNDRSDEIEFYCDGILMALLVSILSGAKIERVSFDFTSIAGKVFSDIQARGKNIFIIGASSAEVTHFSQKISNKFPDLNIVGSRDGFFSECEISEIINRIILLDADFVLVGLGAGKQEYFGSMVTQMKPNTTVFTCGGFIRQETTSEHDYYPPIIDKLNLRAFYRMYKEPHTIKRYLLDYPKNALSFAFYVIAGKIKIVVKS